MVKNIVAIILFLSTICGTVAASSLTDRSPRIISADEIRSGCSIHINRNYQYDKNDPLSTPPYSLIISWQCVDGENLPIDELPINGASPEITSILYFNSMNIVIQARWPMNSQSAEYLGYHHKISAYTYNEKTIPKRFIENKEIENKSPPRD
ncbi:hypothetical protein [Pandoraea sp. NPDC090278]|uniref:hypothetical protein n=1 Tax=Pandoraea sp. NPDC090278 TaxID=3364391 RepID=UPI00383BED82